LLIPIVSFYIVRASVVFVESRKLSRSLPARSTSIMRLTVGSSLLGSYLLTWKLNITCDLDEAWFSLCDDTILFLIP